MLGLLVGLAGSVLPGVLDIFKTKANASIRVEELKAQAALATNQAGLDLMKIQAEIALEEAKKSMPDQIITNNIWIDGLSALIRPVFTIGAGSFVVYCKVKGIMLTEIEMDLCMASFSYWFGGRALKRYGK